MVEREHAGTVRRQVLVAVEHVDVHTGQRQPDVVSGGDACLDGALESTARHDTARDSGSGTGEKRPVHRTGTQSHPEAIV